ncbi:MAG: BrnT family toxin [Candidatus Hydrogenedentes bacterium]|nr:BrnT family toxin [Candidatus Hydrogenedentota bacterium]
MPEHNQATTRFEWDDAKARENLLKHGVGFEEASTVFNDPLSVTRPDPDHSDAENRFIDIGVSNMNQLLVVVYTERGPRIRLISARRATANERQKYEESII